MAPNGFEKVNIFCLLAAIVAVLVLPFRKEVWYDETVSILCSKGISHNTPAELGDATTVSAAQLHRLNTAGNVFHATIVDNGNSFLYNLGLHWFTGLFGNRLFVYTLFSRLCTISLLIALFLLGNMFMRGSPFISLAVGIMAIDNIMGMSHEIRAYAMGAFFITTAAIWFYKFTYGEGKPAQLLLTGLLSVAAVLSHFLSVYVVLVFLGAMLVVKNRALFTIKNILAVLPAVITAGTFFFFAARGLQIMGKQNAQIQHNTGSFSAATALVDAMKYTAVNFKIVFPSFINKAPVAIVCFLLVPALLVFALRHADAAQKKHLKLLFALGISGSIFQLLLALKSQHYTALYFRYFSFCIPFCCLFTAYALHVLTGSSAINKLVKSGLAGVIILPVVTLFAVWMRHYSPRVKYNHLAIANEIVREGVTKIEVPEWSDALLVHSMLPAHYKIDYVRNPLSTNFTLYTGTAIKTVPVIKDNS